MTGLSIRTQPGGGMTLPDIQVDWVWMAQSVLRYNVVVVAKSFNKGSWVSEAWRREHPEEFGDEAEGAPVENGYIRRAERISTP